MEKNKFKWNQKMIPGLTDVLQKKPKPKLKLKKKSVEKRMTIKEFLKN